MSAGTLDTFRAYRLDVIEKDRHYRLSPVENGPTDLVQTVDIVFAAGRIGIVGDRAPGPSRHRYTGLWSHSGYHVGWFFNGGRPLTPGYLREKFPAVAACDRDLLIQIQAAFARLWESRRAFERAA